jgi:hypothetical protein
MVSLKTIKVGDELYDPSPDGSYWPVTILEVYENSVVARWNHNRAAEYSERSVARWRRTPPKPRPRPKFVLR